MRKTFTQYGVGGTRITFELECEQIGPHAFEGSIVKVRLDRSALIGPACALCVAGKSGMLHEHSSECQAQYLRDTGPDDAREVQGAPCPHVFKQQASGLFHCHLCGALERDP